MRFVRFVHAIIVVTAMATLSLSACGDKKATAATAFPDSLADDELVVTVNNQPVTGRDLRVFTLVYEPQSADSLTDRLFNVSLARGYIDRLLLWQEARAAGIVVNDSTRSWFVNAFIASMGGEARVDGYLAAVGISRGELESTIGGDLLVRTFIESNLGADIHVTEADARAYYDKNPERFEGKEGKLAFDDVKDELVAGLRQRALAAEMENRLKRNRAVAIIEPNFDFGGLTQRESTTFTR